LLKTFAATASLLSETAGTLQEDLHNTSSVVLSVLTQRQISDQKAAAASTPPSPPRRHLQAVPKSSTVESGKLPRAERKILAALATHQDRGAVSSNIIAVLTGYSHKSGGFRNSLSALRSAGYIQGYGESTITEAGLAALGDYEELPKGSELLSWWKEHQAIDLAGRRILDVLAQDYPQPVDVATIAERTGYSSTSGGFRNSLARLRSLQLAHGRQGSLVLDDNLA
jgi:hypothetical protein